jgi:thymidine kinase
MSDLPQLIVFVGPMWASKTSSMLSLLDRFRYQKKSVVAFKPQIDDRYSTEDIVTHTGQKFPAFSVEKGDDILKCLAEAPFPPDVIAVDELFMIPGSAKVLVWLHRQGFTIVVSSLDLSSGCKPFAEVKEILPWATRIEKLSACCSICGEDARFSYRKTSDDDGEIVVGGIEKYEPRCWCHHPLVKIDE